MDFYRIIESMNFSGLLRKEQYVQPEYSMLGEVKSSFFDIIQNNKRVLVYGDYDVDGLMAALGVRDALQLAGVTEVDVYPYRKRMHSLDPVAVQMCIQGQYDYFVVCDTGSSDMSLINLVTTHGIKVIVLDHHNTMYSYSEFNDSVSIINTTIENKLGGDYVLSAGALVYTVMRAVLEDLEITEFKQLAAYATISLYADCISMLPKLNRAIYYEAHDLDRDLLPRCVLLFLNKYSAFNARFIGFWFSPRVNAMFRSERLELINELFFTKNLSADVEARCIQKIDELYVSNREMVNKVTDIITSYVHEIDHFVIADLYSVNSHVNVEENMLYNYTGLVANRLSEQFGKTAVVYCRTDNEYKGSVRDLYGRNYLSMFQRLCYAGGHNAAFGIKIKILDFDEFLTDLERLDRRFSIERIENKPIIIDYLYQEVDSAMIEDIALYNEFSGQNVPVVYLRKQIIGNMREQKSQYNYKYSWGDYFIQCEHALGFGSYVLIKPIRSGRTKLLVQ